LGDALRRNRAGSLVEVLLVCGLLVGLAAFMYPRVISAGKSDKNKGLAPTQRARQTEGIAYVKQIRDAIQMYRTDHNEQNPPSLQDLKPYGVTDAMMVDPVSKKPLAYNAETGEVSGTSTPDAIKRFAPSMAQDLGE
jgi:competence protein ComGC